MYRHDKPAPLHRRGRRNRTNTDRLYSNTIYTPNGFNLIYLPMCRRKLCLDQTVLADLPSPRTPRRQRIVSRPASATFWTSCGNKKINKISHLKFHLTRNLPSYIFIYRYFNAAVGIQQYYDVRLHIAKVVVIVASVR